MNLHSLDLREADLVSVVLRSTLSQTLSRVISGAHLSPLLAKFHEESHGNVRVEFGRYRFYKAEGKCEILKGGHKGK
jgi:hypothetical protein